MGHKDAPDEQSTKKSDHSEHQHSNPIKKILSKRESDPDEFDRSRAFDTPSPGKVVLEITMKLIKCCLKCKTRSIDPVLDQEMDQIYKILELWVSIISFN